MRAASRQNVLFAVLLLSLVALGTWLWSVLQRRADQESLETCSRRMMRVAEALDLYASARDWGIYPDKLKSVVPLFIDRLPRCPTAPDRDYTYQRYTWKSPGAEFVLGCPGHHRGVPEGFPKFHIELKKPVTSVQEFMAPLPPALTAKYPDLPQATPPDFHPDFVPTERWLQHPDREWFRARRKLP